MTIKDRYNMKDKISLVLDLIIVEVRQKQVRLTRKRMVTLICNVIGSFFVSNLKMSQRVRML